MPRPLPRELMEQILGDKCLRNSDFARCCRLSKDWLDFFRDRLYSSIDVEILDGDTCSSDDSLMYQYSPWALEVVSRLSDFPAVGRHVKTVRFERGWEQGCGVYTTPLSLFASILHLCPAIDSLSFPADEDKACIPYLAELCVETGRRFSSIDMGRPSDAMWTLLDVVQANLRHLKFSNIHDVGWAVHERPPVFLPALHLVSLSLTSWEAGEFMPYQQLTLDTLLRHSHSSLESIEVAFSPRITLDFSQFPTLRHLTLCLYSTSPAPGVRKAIRSASSVTSLTLSGYLGPSVVEQLIGTDSKSGLAGSLSPRLVRLELPDATALSPPILLFLEHLPTDHPLCRLKFRHQRNGPNEEVAARLGRQPLPPEEDYTAVEEACRERGIKLKLA
ncbi:hypothetical protein JCM6882_008259 [Rhodosporidiobolus microsporus]